MKTYYVYILRCSDKSYYTGITSELKSRILDHQEGTYKNSYTSFRLPVKLVYFCTFSSVHTAISVEKQVKKWSRKKKEALINGDYDQLPNLAKKKFKE